MPMIIRRCIFGRKDPLGQPRFPCLITVISFLFSFPASSATAERLVSKLKLLTRIKETDLKEVTVAALVKIKSWLKLQGIEVDEITVGDDLISCITKVQAPAKISS